jgi:hypothetical protein
MSFIHPKKTRNIVFTPSFRFITTLNKGDICEYINIIMNETGAQTFGYQRMNDQYWGKIKMNNIQNVEFSLSFQNTEHTKSTVIVICVMNATVLESDKLCSKIYDTIKILETTPSVYKKKYKC